jgi:hypothetical protein
MVDDDPEHLLAEIRAARAALPSAHRALLDQLGVQETAIEGWPEGVLDLYATLREPAPTRAALDGAAAAWLNGLRTVAFNIRGLQLAVEGLDRPTRHILLSGVAWHEYGHALSVTRATREHRESGPELLNLLPDGIRQAIDYPARYRAAQVFDEIIATVYALLVGLVPTEGYIRPVYLHPAVFTAFEEVIPWPRIQ